MLYKYDGDVNEKNHIIAFMHTHDKYYALKSIITFYE